MATGDNPITPLFEPGQKITARITAAVTAGRFVKPSGNFEGGPLLDVSTPTGPLTGGNLMKVATCGAGQQAIGVAGTDGAADGDVIPVLNGPGLVVPMTAAGAITAGDKIMSDASGRATTWVTAASEANNALGVAISGAADTATVYVRLFT